MSFRVPDLVPEEDNPALPRKIPGSAGDDFVELIWQKGPFFRRRSLDLPRGDPALPFRTDSYAASGVSTHTASAAAAALIPSTELFMEEDEMASWLYYPLGGDDDPEGVGSVAGVDPTEEPRKAIAAAGPEPGFPAAAAECKVEAECWAAASGRPPETQGRSEGSGGPLPYPALGEFTVVDLSATTQPERSRPVAESRVFFSSDDVRDGATACEYVPTSSSGLSCNGDGEEDAAAAAAMAARRGDERKRRARQYDGFDSHSEDGEFESGGKQRDLKRLASARTARTAEVHNLSERRRRDRINEKMKALEQLIPRCHKSNKASMLDDAIEYMKSLQMQVQMMSMCCNMTPVMFPGVQQYMPSVGMGMPMGMGMDMGLASGGLSRPMMPFLPVMPGVRMAAANGAANFSQRLPMQAVHARPVAALADQMRVQATSQVHPTSSSAFIRTPSAMQMASLAAVCHEARSQNRAITEPGSSKGIRIPEKANLVKFSRSRNISSIDT